MPLRNLENLWRGFVKALPLKNDQAVFAKENPPETLIVSGGFDGL